MRPGRNALAIYQELVDGHGFTASAHRISLHQRIGDTIVQLTDLLIASPI